MILTQIKGISDGDPLSMSLQNSHTTNPSVLNTLQYVVFGSVILYVGRPLFVPLSFALLMSCVLYPLCVWFEHRGFKRLTAILISILILTVLASVLVGLLITQVNTFFHGWPTLSQRLSASYAELSAWLEVRLNVSREQQAVWINNVLNNSVGDAASLIQKTLTASAVSAVLFILIPIYTVLFLYYRHRWVEVLYRIFPHEGRERIREILNLSIKAYYNFIKGMALVYLIVGLLNSIGLYVLGIPNAFLFGFIASILTFIPYVGIIVASLLPISVAWITYNSIWYPLGVVAVFAIVQYLEANLIFPLAVSSRLRLNTLVTIAAIVIGGLLWGVAGMILFIPFLGILKLVADRTPSLKTLRLILGVDEDP